MLASEMIAVIKYVEKNCHGITQLSATRINYFQSQNLPMTVEVEYNSAFNDFITELEAVLNGRVYTPTAKKILNNWYIWAKGELEKSSNIKPFVLNSAPSTDS